MINSSPRLEMKRAAGACMALSLVVSRLDISTQWDQKKVFGATVINTEGIKAGILGWAPSTFVSSRSDRAKQKAAKPEDFMDEEDMAELRDNQKLVGSTDEMDLDFWSRNGKPGVTSEQE